MAKYGEVDWDDNLASDKRSNKFDRDKMLLLQDGMTAVRVLMEKPFRYFFHKVKFENDANSFGRNVRCSTDSCPLCAKGDQQKVKYLVGVVVRKTKELKYFEFGTGIYNGINTIRSNMEGFRNVIEYDLNIVRNSKGTPANFYSVLPGRMSPLSADEVAMAESIDKDWMVDYCKPISPEEVTNTMERISRWIDKNNKPTEDQDAAARAKQKKSQSDDDDTVSINDTALTFKVLKK